MPNQSKTPDAYVGREQAQIKHHVLEKYLEKLTAILAVNSAVFEFTYVDCFAGPWQADEQMQSTSIAISLRVLERCKQMVEQRGKQAKIRALYIEKTDGAFTRLENYLAQNTPVGITAHSIHGDFVESRQHILDWVGSSGHAFFFIDPLGRKGVEIETLAPLLNRPKSEYVINFMYDFINRMVSMERLGPDMKHLFGETIDSDQLDENREAVQVNTYRKNLKKQIPNQRANYPARSAYVKILDPNKNRTKYHLVYVTTHPKGVIKFMDACEGANILQGTVRAQIRDGKRDMKSGITDMFANEPVFVDDSQAKDNAPLIDAFWLDYIGAERTIDESAFADILEDKNWFEGELQASLKRLISSKKIENLNAPKLRPKRPLHYEERGGERLKRVTA
jgi:three-Cys-motif partner protein